MQARHAPPGRSAKGSAARSRAARDAHDTGGARPASRPRSARRPRPRTLESSAVEQLGRTDLEVVGDEVEHRVDLVDRPPGELGVGDAVQRELQLLLRARSSAPVGALPVFQSTTSARPSISYTASSLQTTLCPRNGMWISRSTSIGVSPAQRERANVAWKSASRRASSSVTTASGDASARSSTSRSSSPSHTSRVSSAPPLRARCSTHWWKSVPSRVARYGRSGIGRRSRSATASGSVEVVLEARRRHPVRDGDRVPRVPGGVPFGEQQVDVGGEPPRRSGVRVPHPLRGGQDPRRTLPERHVRPGLGRAGLPQGVLVVHRRLRDRSTVDDAASTRSRRYRLGSVGRTPPAQNDPDTSRSCLARVRAT